MNERNSLSRRSCIAAFTSAALVPVFRCAPQRQNVVMARASKNPDELTAERPAPELASAFALVVVHNTHRPARWHSTARYPLTKTVSLAVFDHEYVTRIAALLLVEDGKLALDQRLTDVSPEFRNLRVVIDLAKGLDSRPATEVMTMAN